MKKKSVLGSLLPLLLVGALTLAFTIQLAKSSDPAAKWAETYGANRPTISVEPQALVNQALGPGSSFSVAIVISDVTNLGGYEYKLSFDDSIVHVTNVAIETEWFGPEVKVWKNTLDTGLMWLVVTLPTGTVVGVDGSGTVVTIDFAVDNYGSTILDIDDTILGDPFATAIGHQTSDGFFTNRPLIHDLAVVDVTALPTAVSQGDPVYITATIENRGDFPETFGVTIYADQEKPIVRDEITIGTQAVNNLQSKSSQTVNFIWDTTGVPYGNYWITAEASVVPGETETAVNVLTDAYLGGICRPYKESYIDVFAYLIQIASMTLVIGAFGIAGIGLIRILGSEKEYLPLSLLKRKS